MCAKCVPSSNVPNQHYIERLSSRFRLQSIRFLVTYATHTPLTKTPTHRGHEPLDRKPSRWYPTVNLHYQRYVHLHAVSETKLESDVAISPNPRDNSREQIGHS